MFCSLLTRYDTNDQAAEDRKHSAVVPDRPQKIPNRSGRPDQTAPLRISGRAIINTPREQGNKLTADGAGTSCPWRTGEPSYPTRHKGTESRVKPGRDGNDQRGREHCPEVINDPPPVSAGAAARFSTLYDQSVATKK